MRFRWVWPGAIVTGLLWRGALVGVLVVRARPGRVERRARFDRRRRGVPVLGLHLGRDPAVRRGDDRGVRAPADGGGEASRAGRPAHAVARQAGSPADATIGSDEPPRGASRAPTCFSTPPIPSTGIRGATTRSRARAREDKPIFLSIGYSTCHWCHVMEHESFESAGDCRRAQPATSCRSRSIAKSGLTSIAST